MQKNEACTCNNIITVSVGSVNGVGREKRSAEGLGRPFIGEILAEIYLNRFYFSIDSSLFFIMQRSEMFSILS